MKEYLYILKRKILAFSNTVVLLFFRLFPIDNNKIAVCSYEGKGGFSCNPKYIVEELHRRDSSYEFYWMVDDINKQFPDYIHKVPNTIFSRNFHLATAKVWIDNYRKPYGTIKRKGQNYVQTWHAGIGLKKIGLCRGSAFSKMAYLVSKNDSELIDLTIIDSKWCEAMYPQGLLYNGPFLHVGLPRCDTLINDKKSIRKNLRLRLDLLMETQILLFAPTFRESINDGKRGVFLERWSIDFKRALSNLEKKFGGKWVLLVRVHPQLSELVKKYENDELNGKVFDVSKDDDMYQILPGIDALITDYSSTIFEASLANIPCFMYADDLQAFSDFRGGLNFKFNVVAGQSILNDESVSPGIHATFPYSVAKNNDELEKNIINFSLEEYVKNVRKFEKDMGIIANGLASEKTADVVEQWLS